MMLMMSYKIKIGRQWVLNFFIVIAVCAAVSHDDQTVLAFALISRVIILLKFGIFFLCRF